MQRKLAQGGKTALLALIGGVIGAGAKMLIEPAVLKTQTDLQKKFWISPLAEMVVGAVGGAFDKTAIIGAGLVGAGTAHMWEGAGLAMSIKKNAASSGASTTSGFNTGALISPAELGAFRNAGDLTAHSSGPSMSMVFSDTGALVVPNG